MLLADRQHPRLHGREPGREGAREVLREDADEALVRPEDGAVDGHRSLRVAVAVDVLELEALGQHREVHLDGRDLPAPAEHVLDVHVDLGAVEGAGAGVHVVGEAVRLQRLVQRVLGRVPLLGCAQALLGAGGQLERGLQREDLVPLAHQLEQRRELVLELIGTAVDVGVVLGELADPDQSGQGPRPLVAVAAPHLAEPERQVAVRAQGATVHVGGGRAVHRLEREQLPLDLHLEHVVLVVLPVPRLLPQPLVDEHRRGDLLVAARVQRLPGEPFELADEDHPLRQPERRPGGDVEEVEEVELATELAVVALLCLLEAPEMAVELLRRQPRGAVDALEHRVPLVAAPVRTRRRQELEGRDVAGRGHVGAAAEILKLALPVERDEVGVDPLEDLHLEGLAALAEEADRLGSRQLASHEGQVGPDELAHQGFDLREVLGGEGIGLGEVVVEAVLDGGPDRELHVGEQPLDRLRHDVRGRVAQRRQRRRITVKPSREAQVPVFFAFCHMLLRGQKKHPKSSSRGALPPDMCHTSVALVDEHPSARK